MRYFLRRKSKSRLELLEERTSRLKGTHLDALYGVLSQLIAWSKVEDTGLLDVCDQFLKKATVQDDEYGKFDRMVLGAAVAHFNRFNPILKAQLNIVPGEEWLRVSYPLLNAAYGINYGLIFCRRDAGQVPQLDQYIWLVHELLHVLVDDQTASIDYQGDGIVDGLVGNLHRQQFIDPDFEHSLEKQIMQDLQRYWKRSESQLDWFHELLIDFCCVHILGPAYIHAFVAEYEDSTHNPYQFDEHPPVLLRATALAQASQHLNWGHHPELQALMERWQDQQVHPSVFAKFHRLSDSKLIQATHETANAFAEKLVLPRVSPETLKRITLQAVQGEMLSGIELLIGGAMRAALTSPQEQDAFERWEQEVVLKAMSAG